MTPRGLRNDQSSGSQFSQALDLELPQVCEGAVVILLASDLMAEQLQVQAGTPVCPRVQLPTHCRKRPCAGLALHGSSGLSAGCHQGLALPWTNLNHLRKSRCLCPNAVGEASSSQAAARFCSPITQTCCNPARLQGPYFHVSAQIWGLSGMGLHPVVGHP